MTDPTEDYIAYMRMWSRRYMQRVRASVHTVAMLRSELEELADMAEGVRGIDYSADRVSASASDDGMVNAVARMDALRAEMSEELSACIQAVASAHSALANVRQPQRAVLTCRYIEGRPWADVADAVGYSVDYCKAELHDQGLVDLFPYIPHEYDELPEAL